MKPKDSGLLVTLIGALMVVVGLTDLINRYLRPSMAPWVVLAGVVLTAIGLAALIVGGGEDQVVGATDISSEGDLAHDHGSHHAGLHRLTRVGWLLALPLLLAVLVNPGAVGSYSVLRQSNSRSAVAIDFDLADYLRTRSYGGQAVDLNVAQLSSAAESEDAELLADTSVEVEGFIVHDVSDPDRATLARIVVGCCAGDGLPATIALADPLADVPDDQWVRVVVRHDLAMTAKDQAADEFADAVFVMESMQRIDQPVEPYLYP